MRLHRRGKLYRDEGRLETPRGYKKDNDFTHEQAVQNYWYTTMVKIMWKRHFPFARKYADNDVKLFYNDYNVFMEEKMDNIYKMVEQLKEKRINRRNRSPADGRHRLAGT